MSEAEKFYSDCIETFQERTKKTTHFLQSDESVNNRIKETLKQIYDFTKKEEIKAAKSSALRELAVHDFDLEQIWQQIELQNNASITPLLPIVTKLVLNKSTLRFGNDEKPSPIEDNDDNLEFESDVDDDDDDQEENLEDIESHSDNETRETDIERQSVKQSAVDDDFFKLHEMEKFLQNEEKKMDQPDSGNSSEESESEESIDLFEARSDVNDDDDDDDNQMELAKYKDFFVKEDDMKKKPQNKFLKEMEETEEDQPSSFELKQNRLGKKIKQIEEEAIEEKSWQLKGEITAENRPQNSLLQEIVEFDLTSRPAPVITEQTTLQLEDIIKQRIKDRVFDSVERKLKPTETPLEYKKKLVLDQEKSKESLAQIYEKDFLQQQELLSKDNTETDEKEPQLHNEINSLMNKLFVNLDALSNFHFTPKPAIPELRIVSNLPAINLEEVAPVATSDATLLAPQEIKTKNKGDMTGKNERTSTDKKRERRKKKLKQKIHVKEKEKMQKGIPGKKMSSGKMTKKNVGKAASSQVPAVKSSKAFFTQLEEQVKSEVKKKSSDGSKVKNSNVPSAKRLKL